MRLPFASDALPILHGKSRVGAADGVVAGAVLRGLFSLNQGPGFLHLWSPNASVQWRISTADEGPVTQERHRLTGPASRAVIPIGRTGGKVDAEILEALAGPVAARQRDGAFLEGLAADAQRPELHVYYRPYAVYRRGLDASGCELPQPLAYYDPGTPTWSDAMRLPVVSVAPGDPATRLGWPPGDRGGLVIYSTEPIRVQVRTLADVLVHTTPSLESATLDVSPTDNVSVERAGGGGDAAVLAHWRNFGAHPFT